MEARTFLKNAWMVFGTVGGVISIASLFDDLVAWIDFIQRMIVAYRGLIDPFWSFSLQWVPFHLPRWVHDYLTVSGLTGVSILWSLHATAREMGFGGMGSVAGVFVNAFLDFKVGGNTFELFRDDARDALQSVPGDDQDYQAMVDQVGREQRTPWLIADGLLNGFLLIVLVVAAPFLIPWLMQWRDSLELRRAARLFANRQYEIDGLPIDPFLKDSWKTALAMRADNYADFGAINALYYSKVQANILAYYLAVAVLFGLMVLINYGLQRYDELARGKQES